MYLCMCKSITDQQIRQAFAQGARSVGDLSARFGIGVECGKCLDDVRQFLDACSMESAASTATPPVSDMTTNLERPVETARPVVPEKPAPERAAWFAVDL